MIAVLVEPLVELECRVTDRGQVLRLDAQVSLLGRRTRGGTTWTVDLIEAHVCFLSLCGLGLDLGHSSSNDTFPPWLNTTSESGD
ncbi:hypothetical protein [Streptomyces sp. 5-6(2022)]|uniref:hypothetical protein n=1 Tax=Streptomyces sp. 5-6(2022) TaxID=2936510 RepID=UPI0023B8B080|nr:hypothetical protein [Streptomyces sp. 5-6(2022)]